MLDKHSQPPGTLTLFKNIVHPDANLAVFRLDVAILEEEEEEECRCLDVLAFQTNVLAAGQQHLGSMH